MTIQLADIFRESIVNFVVQAFTWGAWTTIVAVGVRWTTKKDLDSYLLTHLDEASRREVLAVKDKLEKAQSLLIERDAELARLRLWQAKARKAVREE